MTWCLVEEFNLYLFIYLFNLYLLFLCVIISINIFFCYFCFFGGEVTDSHFMLWDLGGILSIFYHFDHCL